MPELTDAQLTPAAVRALADATRPRPVPAAAPAPAPSAAAVALGAPLSPAEVCAAFFELFRTDQLTADQKAAVATSAATVIAPYLPE